MEAMQSPASPFRRMEAMQAPCTTLGKADVSGWTCQPQRKGNFKCKKSSNIMYSRSFRINIDRNTNMIMYCRLRNSSADLLMHYL
ncbi:hypothetical protein BUALT_Bualt13G0020300 [Buddleja alternifolia]|uniref:Uncharacterized protein n=1 Tax=Buddleja alternifolia TaxID=168488 RepID=A0AAV6WR75_9LAMI|nr:hypothetical protein BUALT_Bualt13G0020300 [Buddleja alternifolia]